MLNVKQTVKGNKLVIEIDLTQEFGISKSGKSVVIATTSGNKNVRDNIMMGINVYKPAK
jgi:hypothetical protein